MKPHLIPAIILLTVCLARGQGAFVYDQQSINLIEGSASLWEPDQPMGQSFTPGLSSIGFVQLYLYDGDVLHNLGSTVTLNLRANSITGTILSSTTPVFMPDGFLDFINFFFPTPAALTPGVTYYLQPVIQSGSDGWGSGVTDGSYVGGTGISQGVPVSGRNLWFREGIVVPEPSSAALGLLAFSGLMLKLLKNRQRQRF